MRLLPTMALRGRYRTRHSRQCDGTKLTEYSCSVITTHYHPKLTKIHKKASPLMLSLDDGRLSAWFNPALSTATLTYLLTPKIHHYLTCVICRTPLEL